VNGPAAHPGSSPKAAEAAHAAQYDLRLYVAGTLPNSLQAVNNLRAVCEERLPGRHSIEVIDFLDEPERALDDGVLVTPTLVKVAPAPQRTIIGTLSDRGALLRALGLREEP
jgi:circadian clock protein KaiB